jgi:enoyl-CoA hydratase/carnithine racemase
MPSTSKLSITQHSPQYWRVTFDNPPINLIDPEMIVALYELLTTIEQDNRVAVVVFDSADPEFFMAHYDLTSDPSPLDLRANASGSRRRWSLRYKR